MNEREFGLLLLKSLRGAKAKVKLVLDSREFKLAQFYCKSGVRFFSLPSVTRYSLTSSPGFFPQKMGGAVPTIF